MLKKIMIIPSIFSSFPWVFAGTKTAEKNLTTPSKEDQHLHFFREHLSEQFNIPEHSHIAWMYEEHTSHLAEVVHSKGHIEKYLATDGLITSDDNTILFAYTADCVPVFFLDPIAQKIALVHAGKSGIEKGIHQKAVEKITDNPSKLLVYLGPSIHSCCYEMDLQKKIVDDLKKKGVKNFEVSPICTCCNPLHLASHRRGESKKHNNWNVFGKISF